MPRNRFVDPEVTRLDLPDGDWIEVKTRLSYGEQKRLEGAALGKTEVGQLGNKDAQIGFNTEAYGIERLFVWIVDWSFCDSRGKRVNFSKDAIRNLDPATVDEIDVVLNAHIAAQEAAKNSQMPAT